MRRLLNKNILLFFITLIVFIGSSCSDEDVFDNDISSTGQLHIRVLVSDPLVIKTRNSGDLRNNDISPELNHYALIYNKDSNGYPDKLIFKTLLEGLEEDIPVKIEQNNLEGKNYTVIVVVNIPRNDLSINSLDESSDIRSLYEILSEEKDLEKLSSSPVIMSGMADSPSSGEYKIVLHRNIAKISVELNLEVNNFEMESFFIYNAPSRGFYTSAVALSNNNEDYVYNKGTLVIEGREEENGILDIFSFPVKSAGKDCDNPEGSFFIVKGKYDGELESSYYRIDLKKNNIGSDNYYDIDPNHWYQITIKSVNGKGYISAAEAARHYLGEEQELNVIIHDHSSNILSMVSDGTRELGISNEISVNNPTASTTATFTIRLYSDSNDYPDLKATNFQNNVKNHSVNDFNVNIIEGANWINLSRVAVGNNSSNENNKDFESKGQFWQYTIKFVPDRTIGGTLAGKVRVSWGNLIRDVNIVCKSSFNYANLFIDYNYLIIHDTDTETQYYTENYWNFVNDNYSNSNFKSGPLGYSSPTKYSNKRLYGVDSSGMGSRKIRNEGFHFPVMYGKNPANPWWYEYRFNLFNFLDEYKYYSISIKRNNVTVSKNDKVWGEDKLVITISERIFPDEIIETKIERDIKNPVPPVWSLPLIIKRAVIDESSNKGMRGIPDDYDYSVAQMVVTLYKSLNDTGTDFSFNLYHTGIFHYGEGLKGENFYYYEVVPLTDNTYWLDRNMGATACGDYNENSNGSSLFSDDHPESMILKGSQGWYYNVANESGNYTAPIIDEGIAPPGYHIPLLNEFEKLISSQNFISEKRTGTESGENLSRNYYSTYYDTQDSQIGKIYFPHARYRDLWGSPDNLGEVDAGYYWTCSPSKDQPGGWLKVFNPDKGSYNFINGDVTKQMSVRCVAGNVESEIFNNISFNFRGATHVYLYSLVNDKRVGLYNFPGKSIAEQSKVDNMNEQEYLHFSTTTSLDVDSLYLFFVYVTKEGKIQIVSHAGDSLTSARGWKYVKGADYSVLWDASHEDFSVNLPPGAIEDI